MDVKEAKAHASAYLAHPMSAGYGTGEIKALLLAIEQLQAENKRLKDGISDMAIAMQGLKGGE